MSIWPLLAASVMNTNGEPFPKDKLKPPRLSKYQKQVKARKRARVKAAKTARKKNRN